MFPNGFNSDSGIQSACNDAPGNRTWTYVTGVGTVALLGVTVFSVVKAVSNGDSMSDEHASAGRRHHHEPFAITPVVSPTGAGATFRMEW
jgi:hypothetical protein